MVHVSQLRAKACSGCFRETGLTPNSLGLLALLTFCLLSPPQLRPAAGPEECVGDVADV